MALSLIISSSSSGHSNSNLSVVPGFINGGEPVVIDGVPSNHSNQQNIRFAVSRNNHENRSLSLVPSFNNGGEPVIINGVSPIAVSSNNLGNRSLSVVPSFNNGGEPVIVNGVSPIAVSSNNHSNSSLSLVPIFNNGGEPVIINGVSPIAVSSNNHGNRSLSLVPSFNNGGEPVITNGVSPIAVSSNSHSNSSLSLVPSFINGGEPVVINGVPANHSNQQKLGFSVSSNNHGNRSLCLVPSFINGGEPVITNGVPSNYSNQQKLGYAVSSNNHGNRSLSVVPSFNKGSEPVIHGLGFAVSSHNHGNRSLSPVPSFNDSEPVISTGVSYNFSNRSLALVPVNNAISQHGLGVQRVMTERRRSFLRNYHSSHSALPVAASEVVRRSETLRARLLSALSTRGRMFNNHEVHDPFSTQNHHQRRARLTITELDEEVDAHNDSEPIAATPLSVCFPPETNYEDDVDSGDGVTHSLPCHKYGPYTCPRCFGKFPTSQLFAAHVSSHYKYETKGQRRRRLMAKMRRRNLCIHHSREGLTLVPGKVTQRKEGPMNMAEAGASGDALLSIVKIKEEPADF